MTMISWMLTLLMFIIIILLCSMTFEIFKIRKMVALCADRLTANVRSGPGDAPSRPKIGS